MKKMNKKGFTLAELLIVVAIIAILVAIAIPVFSAQLDKSKAATEQANARSTYGEAVATYLTENNPASTWSMSQKIIDGVGYSAATSNGGSTWTVAVSGKKSTSGASTYTYPN